MKDVPLCVDLDGTLINTDLLMESLFALIRQEPLTSLRVPFWFLQGKARLKEEIVKRVRIDISRLPYHTEFLTYLRHLHSEGRRLVLATASHQQFAEEVSHHLGFFEAVLATDAGQNLSRARKGACLAAIYGEQGFDYAGNSRADLAVWKRARSAILVNPVPGIRRKTNVPIVALFDDRQGILKVYLKTLFSLENWIWSILIFAVLIQFFAVPSFTSLTLLFFSFLFSNASVSLLGDLLNLQKDRIDPKRSIRSLSSGILSIIHCAVLVPSLFFISVLFTIFLPKIFLLVLLGNYFLRLSLIIR
ncbi:membrane hypothetical protein [Gammaproteobacteria bacterium]